MLIDNSAATAVLTVFELCVMLDDRFGRFPRDVKPLAGVGQVFVLHRQIFCQYSLVLGQSVSVRAK